MNSLLDAPMSPYFQNLFIVNHKRRHKFVAIAKGGSTTLKRITILDDGISEDGSEDIQGVHDILGFRHNGTSLVDVSSDLFPDYTRVAVYRDPIERFISYYKDKVLNSPLSHARKAGLTPETPLEKILEYLEQELGHSDPLWIDEHIRPQARHYQLHQIDIIVHLDDLNHYLHSIGVETVSREYYNSSENIPVELPEPIQVKLKALYQEDYQIIEQNSAKLWQKSDSISLTTNLKQRNNQMKPLTEIAAFVGDDWKSSPYYDDAEPAMDSQWQYLVYPFIEGSDFSNTIDLAAGHGRNTVKLKEIADKIIIIDINQENLDYCQERFKGEENISYVKTDGTELPGIPDESITFIYCWDAMVHFDSDVIRSYLKEFHRVLVPGGRGFCHHSNYTENPGGDVHVNPGWRNFMSAPLFAHYCAKENLKIVQQKVMDWGVPSLDCLSLFEK
ncbi:Methyltransferase type 11 [Rippkaea orientalis PCC 8801]|uniref:Methyltransferase type 11 n=1 Tax=Rippkaea orientalis (strain PCC 8801 / RF-1) TaxID=41431 RepID=B7JZP2_RIPO1|nr:methyltransferase domain-containing protein [Rippkaea orientalis]ACK64985.1 Methyltransferase type 11 [Rippkaea orientalis PCC 8801]